MLAEHGVSARGRHLGEIQHASHRRLFFAADVGVPVLAGHPLGLLVGMDAQQLRMIRMIAGRERVHVKRAEALAELRCAARSSCAGRGRR